MAGEKNWVFWTSGAHIVSGFEQCATDGFVGVDADGVVYLFDNNQNVFASAHASDIEGTIGGWRGTWLTIDDKRFALEFVPLADKIAPHLLIGAISNVFMQELHHGDQEKVPRELLKTSRLHLRTPNTDANKLIFWIIHILANKLFDVAWTVLFTFQELY